ncbi:class I SAM-dependent methyltransferase [Nonomuraea sp. NPDC050540]|uniref:class I SAM-dependent methyltransferase n=1 Tax=Nonomuraea sp. NPDC050540 TaxID=3364367 RepID=UPI00378B27EC
MRSPRAIRHLLRSPGELGLARAYVAGELDVYGDLKEALRRGRAFMSERTVSGAGVAPRHGMLLLRLAMRLGAIGVPPRPPAGEARPAGRKHSPLRDRAAISHHYDLGNEFYALILDPTMSYSCAYWTSRETNYGLAAAQCDKVDLICRKLGLRAGDSLLDVGCGWGALIVHAAERFGARATGVTNSRRQYEYVKELGAPVEVVLQDYRDPVGEPFDAVASIEMGEHVGERNYPLYCGTLYRALKPGGRVLLQQMSRSGVAPGGGPFIERYIAPDMAMRPIHHTLRHLEEAGFEIRDVASLREHYVTTIDAWSRRLAANWDELVHLYGGRLARIWRLYLAGGALAFEDARMSVHQVLAVRPCGRTGVRS